ncbi:MAG: M3 family metallopeptidase, partial [Sutterella sp.]
EGLAKWYGAHAELYAALLNEMHGFRLTMFDTAGVDPLSVSLAQNRMSREALDAIRTAILSRIDEIRETVSVRAPFLGTERPGFCDLMAPAPVFGSSPARTIPYPEGIGIVREALGTVNPAMSDFIGMMLEKGWIDAEPSDKKIGGAFYSRFNEFRMPRVFSSYMGSITSVLQQSHELGHAFHYWTMRDLPMIETEFPMTLTETASTFNEAVVRRHLLSKAEGAERFAMLWQDLRSAANFLMNTMVRMDFELEFLKRRQAGVVSAGECCELMNEAWKRWYGETAEPDTWLWAYKLHYYKTDQFIYNYPYTVGYLMSMLLIDELEKRGNGFYDFYVGMLRDTGRMTLDDIIARHFEGNASDPGLWGRAVSRALRSLPEFQKVVKSMPACPHC